MTIHYPAPVGCCNAYYKYHEYDSITCHSHLNRINMWGSSVIVFWVHNQPCQKVTYESHVIVVFQQEIVFLKTNLF